MLGTAFPSAWYNVTVIPFLKPGKDATDPKNYIPITLTSCLCKILEKIINTRLVFILEQRKFISAWQSDFRCGRSIMDNILMLKTHVRSLPTSFSVFSAEFFAIETALNLIASYFHRHFIIYSDSLSVLDALQSYTCLQTFISFLEHYNELTKKGFNFFFLLGPGTCWHKRQ